MIARIWAEVLKRPQLDVNANFFDRGGNSVTSVQVISRIRETFHIDLQLHRLFEAPTIAELAKAVEAAPGFSSDPLTEAEIGSIAPALQRTFSMLDIQLEGLKEDEILDLVDGLEDWEVDQLLDKVMKTGAGA
ncbi:acyl carrier protein [Bradyrhizobium elkanii]